MVKTVLKWVHYPTILPIENGNLLCQSRELRAEQANPWVGCQEVGKRDSDEIPLIFTSGPKETQRSIQAR